MKTADPDRRFAAACDNGQKTPPPPVCVCPAGIEHEPREEYCDGVDCACKEVKYYNATFDDKTISIEDRSGERVTQKELNTIQYNLTLIFDEFNTYNPVDLPKIKRNLSKIIVGDIESRDTDRVGGIIYPDPDYRDAKILFNLILYIWD
ncbi:MAG: hypothetical protein LBE17_04225 [Treponema sp.]|jgi:hypothetical protein|nr:hypothetical protein [Treponema sp.]